MNKTDEFANIKVNNLDNKYIIDEFIRYYKFIYSNYTTTDKSSKEIFYKLLTIKRIIETIAKYKKKILSGDELSKIKGIGAKTVTRVDEIIKTGSLSEIKEKEKQYEAISELSKIYGIGPTKASMFYEQYGIKSIKDLIKANKDGKIKLTNQMELGIKYADTLVDKIPHNLIKYVEGFIIGKIKAANSDLIPVICGSYRRAKPYSSDIDILISHSKVNDKKKLGKFMNEVINSLDGIFIIDKLTESSKIHFQGFASFKNIPGIKKFKQDITDSTDLANKANPANTHLFDIQNNVIRLDIIIVPDDCFYTALMHFTGSGPFNQKMRLHAKSLGMKLSEYGLFKMINKKYVPLKINSEQDIFNAMLLKYIPPEKR